MAKQPGRKGFNPDYNRGFLAQKTVLGSQPAQAIFKRTFEDTSVALYSIGVVLRSIASAQEVEEVQQVVDGHLQKMAEEIAAEHARLDKLMEENGIQERVQFTDPQNLTVPISSPRAARYLTLIKEIDKVVAKLTALWLCGVLADNQYNKGNYQWISRMRTLSVQIRSIDRRARNAARRRRAEEAKAAQEAKAEEQKAEEPKAEDAPAEEQKAEEPQAEAKPRSARGRAKAEAAEAEEAVAAAE